MATINRALRFTRKDGDPQIAPLAHMLRAYYDRGKGIFQKASEFIMITIPLLAYMIDWGWLRIGPPYIYININPVIFTIGPLSLRWYGLMYAVAIFIGLQVIRGYTARK